MPTGGLVLESGPWQSLQHNLSLHHCLHLSLYWTQEHIPHHTTHRAQSERLRVSNAEATTACQTLTNDTLLPLPRGGCLEHVLGCTSPVTGLSVFSVNSGCELQASPYWPDSWNDLQWCWTYLNTVLLETVMIKNSLPFCVGANNLQQRTMPPHMNQVSLWMSPSFSLKRSDAVSPNAHSSSHKWWAKPFGPLPSWDGQNAHKLDVFKYLGFPLSPRAWTSAYPWAPSTEQPTPPQWLRTIHQATHSSQLILPVLSSLAYPSLEKKNSPVCPLRCLQILLLECFPFCSSLLPSLTESSLPYPSRNLLSFHICTKYWALWSGVVW